MVLGSDWPFAMGTTDPRRLVAHRGTTFTEQVALTTAQALLLARSFTNGSGREWQY